MANFRVQVSTYQVGALPADYCTNTLYFTGTAPATAAAWNTFLAAIQSAYASVLSLANGQYLIKAYDMADPEPRPVKAQYTTAATDGTSGPTEVACCLSYYSGRNLPTSRGRIFLGPFTASYTNTKLVSGSIITTISGLGQSIKDAGTSAGLIWSLHSIKENNYQAITDTWVDNAWDTQRRRGTPSTTRTRHHLT